MAGAANPAMTANPYNQASQAQMGAMGRTAQGLNETAAQGMGAHLLGADPVVNAAGVNISNVLPESIPDVTVTRGTVTPRVSL